MKINARALVLFFVVIISSGTIQAQNVVRGPYLQMQTDDGITVHWRTDINTESVVRYGSTQGNLNLTQSVTGLRTEHEVSLSGLGSAQQFWYSVGNSAGQLAGDESYHFHTAPAQGSTADTRIWVIGDSGTANANARAVRDAYRAWSASNPADLWLMLGDNAYNDGTQAQYQAAVFDTYPEILRQLPLWATLGNHDGHSADSLTQTGPYYEIFNLPSGGEIGGLSSGTEAYYSFDYANIHFVCLDSYDTSRLVDDPMLTWLESDLATNTQPWVIAFWHHPPYTKGSHNSDTEGALIDMRQNALPILEAAGVDLVMTGHSHSYERSMLLDGHYGLSTTLDPVGNVLNPGDGSETGDGAYEKPDLIAAENAGAVYAVAGSSGKISGGALNHPAMFISLNSLGSLVLDVSGNQMNVAFIDQAGAVQDEFSMVKTPDLDPPLIRGATAEDATHVLVEFDQALASAQALDTANYAIAGLTISDAELIVGDRRVRLTTSSMASGTSYTLIVNNLKDLVGNTIVANSSISFDFVEVMTASFQDDTGYNGTFDAYIREYSPDTAHGLETTLQVDGDEPSGNTTDMNILLGWDISSIAAGVTVESAEIQLEVSNVSNGAYDCHSVLRNWDQSSVTWNQASSGTAWTTPGAESPTERGSEVVCTVNAGTAGPMTMNLNTDGIALVQAWVDNPANNHGIIISGTSTTDGADFLSSESTTAATRPKLLVTFREPVVPPNNDPVADFTFDCTDLDCSFFDASSDSDGLVSSWSWDFDDGNFSGGQNPSHTFAAEGDYLVSLTVTDDDGATDSVSANVNVSEPPGSIDQLATADLPAAGSVSGTYVLTHTDDGNAQAITERQSGGKKNRRYSYLSHSWQFSVAPGSEITLFANTWSGGSSEGDTFTFAWSGNNTNFNELFTVSTTDTTNVQSGVIPASGTIYIRVTDDDQTAGNTNLDTVYIDQLFIRSGDATPVDAPLAPINLQSSGVTSSTIALSWQRDANSEVETGFELQRRLSPSGTWSQAATPGGGSTSHVDSGLQADTAYDYRIRASNSGGISPWSATLVAVSTLALPDISLSANGYKIKGRHFIDLSWSGASSGTVDIWRGAEKIATISENNGTTTDSTGNKGAATYVYKVCEANTNTCSSDVIIVF